jgi:hypothetical protein
MIMSLSMVKHDRESCASSNYAACSMLLARLKRGGLALMGGRGEHPTLDAHVFLTPFILTYLIFVPLSHRLVREKWDVCDHQSVRMLELSSETETDLQLCSLDVPFSLSRLLTHVLD